MIIPIKFNNLSQTTWAIFTPTIHDKNMIFFYLKKTSIIEFWMVNEFELWTISINNYWAIIQGGSFFFFLWVICMVKIIFLTIILIIKNSITCHEKHGQYFLGRELTCFLGYVLRAFAPILQIRFFLLKL